MEENEVDRASQRANLIEQRMFEITLSSIDTLKHATAIELHKSQNEMKKRLRIYRDRQREIVKERPDAVADPIEEIMTRQMKNKAQAKMKTRPKTCPNGKRKGALSPRSKSVTPHSSKNNKGKSLRNGNRRTCSKKALISDTSSESESEMSGSDVEIDGSFMIDQQKSKIDLRPQTAMDMSRRGTTLDHFVASGRLGPAVRQIRYFDEDELRDRGSFYAHIVQRRIREERDKLSSLDDAVAKFCGSETIQTMSKKMSMKRNLFARNTGTEWTNTIKPSNKGKTATATKKEDKTSKTAHVSSLRPSTSLGFSKASRSNINSFKRPSYIATR